MPASSAPPGSLPSSRRDERRRLGEGVRPDGSRHLEKSSAADDDTAAPTRRTCSRGPADPIPPPHHVATAPSSASPTVDEADAARSRQGGPELRSRRPRQLREELQERSRRDGTDRLRGGRVAGKSDDGGGPPPA